MKRPGKSPKAISAGGLVVLLVLALASHAFGQKKPRFAYVANSNDNNVSAYTIDSTTGALTPLPGSPFAAGRGAVSLAVDPSGKFAYVANLFDNNVSAYTIDASTGALTPVPGSPFAAGSGPFSVAIAGEETPAQQITDLINTINSFNLQAGIANSLDAKLQAALASLAANDVTPACNQISAFINEVMAQSGNMLTVAQANQLIAQANAIKTALGCP